MLSEIIIGVFCLLSGCAFAFMPLILEWDEEDV